MIGPLITTTDPSLAMNLGLFIWKLLNEYL